MPIIEQAFDMIGQFTAIISTLKLEILNLRKEIDEKNNIIAQQQAEITRMLEKNE